MCSYLEVCQWKGDFKGHDGLNWYTLLLRIEQRQVEIKMEEKVALRRWWSREGKFGQITTVGSSRSWRCVRSAFLQGAFWKILTETVFRSSERLTSMTESNKIHVTQHSLYCPALRYEPTDGWHGISLTNEMITFTQVHVTDVLLGLTSTSTEYTIWRSNREGLIRKNPSQFSHEELEIKLRLSADRGQFLTLLVALLSFPQPFCNKKCLEHR